MSDIQSIQSGRLVVPIFKVLLLPLGYRHGISLGHNSPGHALRRHGKFDLVVAIKLSYHRPEELILVSDGIKELVVVFKAWKERDMIQGFFLVDLILAKDGIFELWIVDIPF
jgi:hypothetical protein